MGGRVVGIDLAGSEKRDTGFCLLDVETLEAEVCILHSDGEILEASVSSRPLVVAVDAPLSIPRGRRSIDERSPVHFRECDLQLRRLGIRFFPITLGPMRMLTKRGMRIKEMLENAGMDVIEVYPGGAQDILGIPRKSRGLEELRKGLEELGIKGLRPGMTGDELDAVTAAYVGMLYVRGEYTALGDPDEGLIIMPPIPGGWRPGKQLSNYGR